MEDPQFGEQSKVKITMFLIKVWRDDGTGQWGFRRLKYKD